MPPASKRFAFQPGGIVLPSWRWPAPALRHLSHQHGSSVRPAGLGRKGRHSPFPRPAPKAQLAKPKAPKAWRATVTLDRLDPATGRWRITTGPTKEPLPRAVATDPAVWASIVGWMSAHKAKHPPTPDATQALDDAIRA